MTLTRVCIICFAGPFQCSISRIVHLAAATRSRHLILVTGVPGAGKTLVGLQAVHAKYLDDLAVEREGGRSTTPAVFLSGNAPLVEVLQYEMRSVGDGKTFVRFETVLERLREVARTIREQSAMGPQPIVETFDVSRVVSPGEKRGATRAKGGTAKDK